MAVEEFLWIRKWFKELPWRAKLREPLERAYQTVFETGGVKSDVAFCLRSSIEKTNNAWGWPKISTQGMAHGMGMAQDALKSIPGLADGRVPHGGGDGPRTPPRCIEGVWKKFQMTNLTMPYISCFKLLGMKGSLIEHDRFAVFSSKFGVQTPNLI